MKKIAFILIVFISLTSCTKDQEQPKENLSNDNNLQENILEKMVSFKDVEKRTIISATQIRGEMTQINTSRSSKTGSNSKNQDDKSEFYIDSFDWDDSSQSFIRVAGDKSRSPIAFGKTITIKSTSSINGKSSESGVELYNPEEIKITNAEEIQNSLYNNDGELTIEWDPDPQNSNPIVIYMIARNFNLESISDQHFDLMPYKFFQPLDDDGSVTISQDILYNFPNDVEIDIILSRGNATVLQDELFAIGTSDMVTVEVTEGIKKANLKL